MIVAHGNGTLQSDASEAAAIRTCFGTGENAPPVTAFKWAIGHLIAAAGIVVGQINNLRPIVSIPDILAAARLMKSLNPLHVVPGHGTPGTVKIFEDSEKYYALLLERVGRLAKQGKSLDQIKKEVRMPEYENWAAQERFLTNVEAAYRAVKGG